MASNENISTILHFLFSGQVFLKKSFSSWLSKPKTSCTEKLCSMDLIKVHVLLLFFLFKLYLL